MEEKIQISGGFIGGEIQIWFPQQINFPIKFIVTFFMYFLVKFWKNMKRKLCREGQKRIPKNNEGRAFGSLIVIL
jgi:hypothetical protein